MYLPCTLLLTNAVGEHACVSMWRQELRSMGSQTQTEAKLCQQEAHIAAQHQELQGRRIHFGNPG